MASPSTDVHNIDGHISKTGPSTTTVDITMSYPPSVIDTNQMQPSNAVPSSKPLHVTGKQTSDIAVPPTIIDTKALNHPKTVPSIEALELGTLEHSNTASHLPEASVKRPAVMREIKDMQTQAEAAPYDDSCCSYEGTRAAKKDKGLSTGHKDVVTADALTTTNETSVESEVEDAKSPVENPGIDNRMKW